ncbi:MAG: carboxypeptidase-like regulatory domain-containing protein [Planctomycetota bacterium]
MSTLPSRHQLGVLTLFCLALLLAAAWAIGTFENQVETNVPTSVAVTAKSADLELEGQDSMATQTRSRALADAGRSRVDPTPAASPLTQRGSATLEVLVTRPGGASPKGIKVLLRSSRVNAPTHFDDSDVRGIALEQRCGPDGTVVFERTTFGSYRVSARDSDGAEDALEIVLTRDAKHSLELVKPGLDDGLVVEVQDARGTLVPFAVVKVTGALTETAPARSEGARTLESTCDAEGRTTFPGVIVGDVVVHAEAPDGRRGWKIISGSRVKKSDRRERQAVVLIVAATGTIEGQLLGRPNGWSGQGRVTAWALTRSHPHYTSFGLSFECTTEGDRYSIEGLGPGRYFLTFVDTEGLRVVYPKMGRPPHLAENSRAPIEVIVEAGKTTVQNLSVVTGATLAGTVQDGAGAPIEGVRIHATYAPSTSNFPDGYVLHGANVSRLDSKPTSVGKHPLNHWSARTDEEGRYRIPGLPGGKLRVEVICSGRSYDRREAVELRDGAVKELEHVLVQAGAIEGIEPGGGHLGVRRMGESVPVHLAVLPQAGNFYFPGLAPGTYEVVRYASSRRGSPPPVRLISVEVKANETVWLDLRTAPRPHRYELRLTNPFGAIADTYVLPPGRVWKKTDSQGKVAFESTFPLKLPFTATVMRGPVEVRVSVAEATDDRGVWKGELFLDAASLALETVHPDDSPSAAVLKITSNDLAGDSIESATAKEISVGSEGALELDHLVPGRYRIAATFPSGVEVASEVAVPETRSLKLRAYAAGDLSLLVIDPASQPLDRAWVYARWWSGEDAAPLDLSTHRENLSSRSAQTVADGRVTMRGLPVGALLVEVGAHRSSWQRHGPLVKRTVELRDGEEAFLSVTVD